MPSAQAQLLTRRHRRELGLIARLVAGQIGALARSADMGDIDAWWDRASPTARRSVLRGALAAQAASARYLGQHAAIEGAVVRAELAPISVEAIETSLRIDGPVVFKKHMAISGEPGAALRVMGSELSGSAQRLTLSPARNTVMRTFGRSPTIAGWRRITSGTPCPFCAMLASRGAVYSKGSVSFQAHKRCSCTAEPIYGTEAEPPEVLGLREQWNEATRGLGGTDALNAFRRARGR